MDLDFAGKIDKDKPKQQNINKKKINNRKPIQRRVKIKKPCEICDKDGHNTKECFFNPLNPRSHYNNYYL